MNIETTVKYINKICMPWLWQLQHTQMHASSSSSSTIQYYSQAVSFCLHKIMYLICSDNYQCINVHGFSYSILHIEKGYCTTWLRFSSRYVHYYTSCNVKIKHYFLLRSFALQHMRHMRKIIIFAYNAVMDDSPDSFWVMSTYTLLLLSNCQYRVCIKFAKEMADEIAWWWCVIFCCIIIRLTK